VDLLTIGDFARAAGLTPRALRLYDRLGLLPPAAVDPESGYRFYDPAQLRRARLVAALRRLDMPLAEIRAICDLDPAAAAEAITEYWHRVAAETAIREQLATFLVDSLSGRDSTVTEPTNSVGLRYSARTDSGAVQESNDDSAYASERLLAVADGGRGCASASTAAVAALEALELPDGRPAELLTMLADAVADADRTVRKSAVADHQPFTTLTAMLRSGSQLALVHVGDTRAYLLRGGELFQLTQDHTYVQTLLDQGKLRPVEAAAHPQRKLLVRALGACDGQVEADLALRTAIAGDRYLLCSDGLSTVVGRSELQTALGENDDPEQVVQRLVELAYAHGAPDNIACVVADVAAA
jgi:PPM family protein phosphatase